MGREGLDGHCLYVHIRIYTETLYSNREISIPAASEYASYRTILQRLYTYFA